MDKLSPDRILNKTMGYVFLKALLPLGTLAISLITMAIIVKVSGGTLGIIGALIWLVVTVVATIAVRYFLNYTVKAGHVAVITDAVTVGIVPDDMFKIAREIVQYRFPSCNEYFAFNNEVNGAVGQLQKTLNTFGERYMSKPVVSHLLKLCKIFVGMALSFVGDCCLGYTFWRDGKPLYTSITDGMAIYHLCWKRIVEHALFLAVEIIVTMVLVFVLIFCIFAVVFTETFGGSILAGALAASAMGYFVASAIKAVVDSNLMIKTMVPYLEEAQYAEINEEDYETACKASPKFQKLYQKAKTEVVNTPSVADNDYPSQQMM